MSAVSPDFYFTNPPIVELTKADVLPNGRLVIDEKVHCSLTSSQKLHNTANLTVAGVAGAAATVLTAGAPLAVQAATSIVPVPLDWLVPVPTKNAYFLGYMHDTSTCVRDDRSDPRTFAGGLLTQRGAAVNEDNGCFVWSTLSYNKANSVRVVVFGGGGWRHVFQTEGTLVTWLDIYQQQLCFCMWDGTFGADTAPNSERCQRIPVHHMDQVMYVSCGERPSQCKWHVTVANGQPVSVVFKRPGKSTGGAGVSMPDKGAIMKVAKACGVHEDGSVTDSKSLDNSLHAWKTSFVRALDPERLNFSKNRSLLGHKRMEQAPGAVPWWPQAPPQSPVPRDDARPKHVRRRPPMEERCTR
jgi:hypothetical protein